MGTQNCARLVAFRATRASTGFAVTKLLADTTLLAFGGDDCEATIYVKFSSFLLDKVSITLVVIICVKFGRLLHSALSDDRAERQLAILQIHSV